MKKLISILLAVAMLATMSVTAFAATNTGGDSSINVKGIFVAAQGTGEKISVDVAWEGMEFTYTEASAGEWLPGQHEYAGTTTGGWSTNKGKITVTNHSSVAVTATLSFATAVAGVIGTFTETSGTENDNVLALATAVKTEYANAPQASAEFGISGAAITETKDTLGTITVAIADPSVVTTAQQLKEAVARGGEIKLGDDIDISSEQYGLDINTNLTINLNGKTITGDWKVFFVVSGGTLTILGDGALKINESNLSAISVAGGTVNLAGGEIESTVDLNDGMLNITDGKIDTVSLNGGTCTVGGGQITHMQVNSGTCTITDGKISYMHVNGGTCTVSGGQIDELHANAGTSVSGGLIGNLNGGNCIVTGGTFLFTDPTSYVDETTHTVTYSDDKWTVTEK